MFMPPRTAPTSHYLLRKINAESGAAAIEHPDRQALESSSMDTMMRRMSVQIE
jgi:hypothetical protein